VEQQLSLLKTLNEIMYSATVLLPADLKPPNGEGYHIIPFATESMRETFVRFGELIAMDVTYNVNNLGMQLLTLLVRTNTFRSIPVFLCVLHDEKARTLIMALDFFVKWVGKDNAGNIKSVMLDKSASERKAILTVLPQVDLILCKFHAFKANDVETGSEKYRGTHLNVHDVPLFQHLRGSFRRLQASKTEEEYIMRVSSVIHT